MHVVTGTPQELTTLPPEHIFAPPQGAHEPETHPFPVGHDTAGQEPTVIVTD